MANRNRSVILQACNQVNFIVDAADAFAVSRYSWSLDSYGYPQTRIGHGRSGHNILLHAFLLGYAPSGLEWDHINRDKLDNRRSNLRLVTHLENIRNSGARSNSQSGVKGVHPHHYRRGLVWRATISVAGKQTHLGCFNTLEEAAQARQRAEKELW